MLAAVIALLAGDVWYAAWGVRGELLPPLVVSTPFVAAYLLITAAALHPSQRRDAPAGARVADAWSWRRLVLLSVSLGALVLLLAISPAGGGSPLTRWAGVVTVALVLALLLLRAVSAVNGQARARALLAHRASHDPLTDLPNRDVLRQQLAELTAQAPAGQGRHWLFYVDLDGFKRVNDTRGHHAGDELLQVTGARLREIAGSGGTVARLAGDEFVVLAGGDEARMREIADRLVRELARPVRVAGTDAVVTASVGVSAVRSSAQTAMREADTAMYQAKKDGRGQWLLFDATMRSDQGAAVELELHLRHAVDEEALSCAYQLIVDIGTGRPVGAEALLRWERPLAGPVSPVEFVPLLEETGLINRVGLATLRRALLQLARWREQGLVDHDFRMSVNVAPRQLLDPAFADLVRAALAEAGVEGGSLILEITESSVLADSEVVMDTLLALRRMGIGLAVDDFGTGYSALSYLRTLPVTRVKIDRSFVANLGEDSGSDEALVRAVVAVSAALGLGVTAEGIETDAQREILRRLAVRHGQGWLWARAADAETVGAVLASWSRRALR
nr:EAL domain-containing protein [Kineococcus vitellinus]